MINVAITIAILPVWVALVFAVLWIGLAYFASRLLGLRGVELRLFQLLLAVDQFANALAFGNKDEYISTRAGRCASKGYNRPCYWLCRILHLFDKDHCKKSADADIEEALAQLGDINDK